MSAVLNLDTIRIFLHILAVTVWVGGQIVMMAIVPILKEAGVDGLPAKVAKGFQNIAWPALAVAIFTGFWNIFAIDIENATTAWNIVFGFKFLLVIISRTRRPSWMQSAPSSPMDAKREPFEGLAIPKLASGHRRMITQPWARLRCARALRCC